MKISFLSSRVVPLAAMAICIGTTGVAQAAGTQATMAVQAIVPVSCTGSIGTTMDFNSLTTSLALAVSQTDSTGTIGVTCTNTGAYTVTAGNGNNFSTTRRMLNGTTNYLSYALYSDSGRSTDYTTVAGTGNGALQTLTIYGRIPSGQTAGAAGSYTDSVTFTVTY